MLSPKVDTISKLSLYESDVDGAVRKSKDVCINLLRELRYLAERLDCTIQYLTSKSTTGIQCERISEKKSPFMELFFVGSGGL
jgi:hypothetical protein